MNIYHVIAMSPQGGEGNPLFTLLPFLLIILIFYFMILRPQQKRQKEREQLLNSVKKGDKVITAGGLHGTVVGIEEKIILIQVADNVKMKFDRTAIASITRAAEVDEKAGS